VAWHGRRQAAAVVAAGRNTVIDGSMGNIDLSIWHVDDGDEYVASEMEEYAADGIWCYGSLVGYFKAWKSAVYLIDLG